MADSADVTKPLRLLNPRGKFNYLPPYENRKLFVAPVVAYAFGLAMSVSDRMKGGLQVMALARVYLKRRMEAHVLWVQMRDGTKINMVSCFDAEQLCDFMNDYPEHFDGRSTISVRGLSFDTVERQLTMASYAVQGGELRNYKRLIDHYRSNSEMLTVVEAACWRVAECQKAISQGQYLRRALVIRSPVQLNEEK